MTGCTSFLVNMMTTRDALLVNASAEKLALKYSVSVEWVRMCLEHWMRRSR